MLYPLSYEGLSCDVADQRLIPSDLLGRVDGRPLRLRVCSLCNQRRRARDEVMPQPNSTADLDKNSDGDPITSTRRSVAITP